MMKKTISVLLGFLLVTILFSMVSVNADSSNNEDTFYAGGDGTSNNPYHISNWHHLNNVRNHLNKNFILINNLDSNTEGYTDYNVGDGWESIGKLQDQFTGTFDGDDYTISNLFIDRDDADYIALFRYTGSKSEISNVFLEYVDTTGNHYVGGLVGVNYGTITNSYSTGRITGSHHVGGLVGRNLGTITNSYSTGSITGNDRVGGLVGLNRRTITDSYSTGSITGKSSVGGLVGYNYDDGTITNSYSTGSITGNDRVGGLVGRNLGSISNSYSTGRITGDDSVGGLVGTNHHYATITNSYSTGSITGKSSVGGLVGYNAFTGKIINSFYDSETSGQSDTGKVISKTTAEMKTLSTFSNAGWNIENIGDFNNETWFIDEVNDYPKLGWQHPSFEIIDDNDENSNGDDNDIPVENDKEENDKVTPGFEILLLITAVLIFVFYRKSKKNLNKNK
jgi:hypothetical protein